MRRLDKVLLKGLVTASILLIAPFEAALAQTLPEGLKFKRVKKNSSSLTLKNCNLAGSIKKFQVTNKGKKIQPAKGNRDAYTFPQRFSFFACATQDNVTSLYAKKGTNGAVSQFTFTTDDFPENENDGISSVCPNGTRGIGFGVLYKPAADASDARQGKPVVLLQGSNKNRASALRIYASNGTEVCRFSFKASSIPGVNGGADHYFSGWSGGCGKTGSQISTAARAASGNSSIYIEWKGGQCLGPVNPTSRVGGIG
ncbi:MAG: hypothetical protein J5J00_13900 [Deltaproteobacteria bacterium]|nr:hypothetical protein [Deltaproteobacteria bacterium]